MLYLIFNKDTSYRDYTKAPVVGIDIAYCENSMEFEGKYIVQLDVDDASNGQYRCIQLMAYANATLINKLIDLKYRLCIELGTVEFGIVSIDDNIAFEFTVETIEYLGEYLKRNYLQGECCRLDFCELLSNMSVDDLSSLVCENTCNEDVCVTYCLLPSTKCQHKLDLCVSDSTVFILVINLIVLGLISVVCSICLGILPGLLISTAYGYTVFKDLDRGML